MHVKLKNLPRLGLSDLLRRRKMTLQYFLNESGIVAYGALIERCDALGVRPPSEEDFDEVVKVKVTSQQDGVIVLEPPPLAQTTEELPTLEEEPHASVDETSATSKSKKKKKLHEASYDLTDETK